MLNTRGAAQYELSRFRLKCSQQSSRVKYLNQLNVAEPKYKKKSVVMGYAPGSTILPHVTVFISVKNSIFGGKKNKNKKTFLIILYQKYSRGAT